MPASKATIEQKIREALSLNSETNVVEFKDARGGLPGDLWRPITAFANTPPGGCVVFGVQERQGAQGRSLIAVGGLDLATIQEKIVSLLEHKIVNHSDYDLYPLNMDEVTLLVLNIGETDKENKPCYNTELGMHKGACIRIGNVNRLISEEELRAILRYTPAYNYDKTPLVNMSAMDLDQLKLTEYLTKSAARRQRPFDKRTSTEKVLTNIGLCASDSDGQIRPTLAGGLLFLKEIPQLYEQLSRYVVRCVRFSGRSPSSEIIDQQEVEGSLAEQVDNSMKFVLRNIRSSAKIVGTKREESYEYPQLALREAIVNALIHRDYSNVGTYVQIAIYQDRIEIANPGTLPPGVTVENLMLSQFSRNAVIARVMRDLDYMEEFGRGINLIFTQMASAGLVEPLFQNSANSFKVTLLGSVYKDLNERQLKFWHLLQSKRHLTASIAHECFPDLSRPTINADLRKMLDLGLIRQKGLSSSTYYEPEF